jgi:hypothetical protein
MSAPNLRLSKMDEHWLHAQGIAAPIRTSQPPAPILPQWIEDHAHWESASRISDADREFYRGIAERIKAELGSEDLRVQIANLRNINFALAGERSEWQRAYVQLRNAVFIAVPIALLAGLACGLLIRGL